MSSADDRLARLLALLPWLRAHPGVAVAEAASRFGITEAQLRADVSLLWFCGLPGLAGGDLIDVEFEGDRVRVLDAQTLDRPLRLTGDEGVALLAAARALRELPGLVDVDALDRVIAKLSAAVASSGELPALDLQLGPESVDGGALAAVRTALQQRRRIRLRYLVESRDEMTDRVVDPLELRLVQGQAYLHAFDPGRGGARSFRLDRIDSAEVLEEPSSPPAEVLAELAAERERLGSAAFLPRPKDPTVTLELEARARWVADYYPVEALEELADGNLRIVLRTADTSWLVRLLLRLGGSGWAVEPPELVAAVAAAAETALSSYAEKT